LKTTLRPVALAFALALLVSAPAIAGVTPEEHSSEQTQTLSGGQSAMYKELQNFAGSMPVMEILRRTNDRIDEEPSRLVVAHNWAKDRVEDHDAAKVNSLYFLMYSDLSARSALTVLKKSNFFQQYSKAAYQALVTFELMFLADAARCVNPAAAAPAVELLKDRYQSLQYIPNNATPEEMQEYWDMALGFEDASERRPPNAEICSNGVAIELAQAANDTAPERLDAAYIDDAKWKVARQKVRAKVLAEWQESYAPIKKTYEARKAHLDAQHAQDAADQASRDKAEAARQAAAQTAAAEKARQEAERMAAEKQKRKDEAQRYHDTYTPDHYVDPNGSSGTSSSCCDTPAE
jgi:hypothetical protein